MLVLVCRSMVDLAFVIDGSGSIEHYGKGNFKRCLRFVQRVVRQFKINSGRTRVGIILYSTRPRLMFRFNKYYRRKRQLLSAINRIPYPRGLTKTGWAMRYSYSTLFRYARRGARKVNTLYNRPLTRWRHFTTSTRILQGFALLCKLGLLWFNPRWEYQI